MKRIDWGGLRKLPGLLLAPRPEPGRQAERIVSMQLHVVLPARAGLFLVVLFYLFQSDWFYGGPTTRGVVMETLKQYFVVYSLCNAVAGALFGLWRRLPPGLFQWILFTLGLLDGLFVAALALITGGFSSIAYWLFPGLIVLNAISIPLATPQIVLNLVLSLFYLSAGVLEARIGEERMFLLYIPGRSAPRSEAAAAVETITNAPAADDEVAEQAARARRPVRWDDTVPDLPGEATSSPVVLQMFVLWLLTACCYGVQVLAERQRRAIDEAREFAMREGQLRSAARFAAEFAHQIKNPLAIINNTVYSLERALKQGRNDVTSQIQIIREEVERSDRIVTQILGYGQLSEGRVERLRVAEELDRAIEQVFPAAAGYDLKVERRYGPNLPPLLMHRRHLSDVLVNLLQNAREALNGTGRIIVAADQRADEAVEISISDTGPGIPRDKLERVFEAYYTTKDKGTGLGLSMVKHNVELYAGSVRVESELGKGARFILTFPVKTVMAP